MADQIDGLTPTRSTPNDSCANRAADVAYTITKATIFIYQQPSAHFDSNDDEARAGLADLPVSFVEALAEVRAGASKPQKVGGVPHSRRHG